MPVKHVKARREDRDYEDLVRLYLEDVGRHDLLTKDDEVRLAQAIEGGVAARTRARKRRLELAREALRRMDAAAPPSDVSPIPPRRDAGGRSSYPSR